jgi:DNA polymerase III epsilon subunit-like protein
MNNIPVSTISNRIIVFDVETTGLLNNRDATKPKPYIIQLSFVIYGTASMQTIRTYNEYIRIPENVEVTPEITKLTGITKEQCNNGVDIADALIEFYKEYMLAETIVAHNIKFDSEMIKLEIERNIGKIYSKKQRNGLNMTDLFNPLYNKIHRKKLYCTMMEGKDVCDLWVEVKAKPPPSNNAPPSILPATAHHIECPNDTVKCLVNTVMGSSDAIMPKPRRYKKFPKLKELYVTCFGTVPEGLHNALVDTMACLRCYLELCRLADKRKRLAEENTYLHQSRLQEEGASSLSLSSSSLSPSSLSSSS